MRSKMAASLFRRIFVVSNKFKPNIRYYHPSKRKNLGLNAAIFLGVPCVCAVAWRTWRKFKENGEIIPVVQAAQTELAPDRVTTYRELKFKQFASVQYEGIIYMTPQDFLESVTEETPRRCRPGPSGMLSLVVIVVLCMVPYFLGYKTECLPFQNHPKTLDPSSYKMDLEFGDCSPIS